MPFTVVAQAPGIDMATFRQRRGGTKGQGPKELKQAMKCISSSTSVGIIALPFASWVCRFALDAHDLRSRTKRMEEVAESPHRAMPCRKPF
jgi:hypothetical protein